MRRLRVLGIGLLCGALFALLVAGPMMPSDTPLSHRAFAWSSVMGGPILGTAWGMATDYPIIRLGWLGLFLIPAHPVRPQPVMGCVTVIGLVLWFIAGALAMMVAAHGG